VERRVAFSVESGSFCAVASPAPLSARTRTAEKPSVSARHLSPAFCSRAFVSVDAFAVAVCACLCRLVSPGALKVEARGWNLCTGRACATPALFCLLLSPEPKEEKIITPCSASDWLFGGWALCCGAQGGSAPPRSQSKESPCVIHMAVRAPCVPPFVVRRHGIKYGGKEYKKEGIGLQARINRQTTGTFPCLSAAVCVCGCGC
jgi:hypothetical protein